MRHDWNPATEVILQNHLRFRQAFLEARAASNQEAMNLLSAQAVGTHNNLERLIRRERLLSITEGWNPHAERPGRARPNPNHPATRQGNEPAQQGNQPAQRGGAAPARGGQGRMRRRQEYRNSVYGELFRMTRTLQSGYQALDQSRARNQGMQEEEEHEPFFWN